MNENAKAIKSKIKEIEENINDLKSKWPAHSLKPAMFELLESLEDELEFNKSLLADKEK